MITMVEGQTEKEKQFMRRIQLKNHVRTRLPRGIYVPKVYDDIDLKPSEQ